MLAITSEAAVVLFIVFYVTAGEGFSDCSNLVKTTVCGKDRSIISVSLNDSSSFAISSYNNPDRSTPVRIRQNWDPPRDVACCSTTVLGSFDSAFDLDTRACRADNVTQAGVTTVTVNLVIEDPYADTSCPFQVQCKYRSDTATTTTTVQAGTTTSRSGVVSTTRTTPTRSTERTTASKETSAGTTTTTSPTTISTTTATTTTLTTTTTPATTTTLPCVESLSFAECDVLAKRDLCRLQPSYMKEHCGITCGFCPGTFPTTASTTTPHSTPSPELPGCTWKKCSEVPGTYNCESCYKTCHGAPCIDSANMGGPDGCQSMISQGYPCSAIKQYCAASCGICNTLHC